MQKSETYILINVYTHGITTPIKTTDISSSSRHSYCSNLSPWFSFAWSLTSWMERYSFYTFMTVSLHSTNSFWVWSVLCVCVLVFPFFITEYAYTLLCEYTTVYLFNCWWVSGLFPVFDYINMHLQLCQVHFQRTLYFMSSVNTL